MTTLYHSILDYQQQQFAVIGLGKTGKSVIRYLKHKYAKIIAALDTRESNITYDDAIADINCIYGKLYYIYIREADVIVLSPGISLYEPIIQQAKNAGKLIINDIELFAQHVLAWQRTKIIGISGTNGKSTTASMTHFIALKHNIKSVLWGNIGYPVLDGIISAEQMQQIPELIVLELSSFQLEVCYSLRLDIATVLNISHDHLDRYRDILEYANTKSNIFNSCTTQLLNLDDPIVMAMRRQSLNVVFFTKSQQTALAYLQQSAIQDHCTIYHLLEESSECFLAVNGTKVLNVSCLHIQGIYNYLNALASIALLQHHSNYLDHSETANTNYIEDYILQHIAAFRNIAHRMQFVANYHGINYIEDSKATNVAAVIAGVSSLVTPVHLILGGDSKKQDLLPLRLLVQQKCQSVAIIGKDALLIFNILANIRNVYLCNSIQDAIITLQYHAKAGDNIVLSPACASTDMFRDYQERAEIFIALVHKLNKNITVVS